MKLKKNNHIYLYFGKHSKEKKLNVFYILHNFCNVSNEKALALFNIDFVFDNALLFVRMKP